MSLNKTTKPIIFHADLSDAHDGEDYFVAHGGKRIKLVPHSKETLSAAIGDAPHLLSEKEANRVTHYTPQGVHMHSGQVGRVHLRHTMNTFPDSHANEGISHSAIVIVPTENELNGIECYHAKPIDYTSTAQTLLFHHPDLVTKNADGAKVIMGLMESGNISTYVNELAINMRAMGPPTETSGWAKLIPFLTAQQEASGDYNKMSHSKYNQQPTDQIQQAAFEPLAPLLLASNNTASLENVKWTVQDGKAVQNGDGNEQLQKFAELLAKPAELRASNLNSVLSSDNWNVSIGSSQSINDLKYSVEVLNATNHQVKVTFENSAFRYLALYVTFYDADGTPMNIPNWKPDDPGISYELITEAFDNQYPFMRYIGLVSPMNSVYAIPVPPPGMTDVTLSFPPGAVSASLFGSGLGTGADMWPKSTSLGGVLTGVFNLGVPSLMMVTGVAAQTYKPLYDIITELGESKKFLVAAALAIAAYIGGTSVANKTFNWSAATSLAQFIFNTAADKALVWLLAEEVEGEVVDEIPFAGWIMVGINLVADIAQMTQTIVSIAESPWNIENKLAVTITSTIDVHPDPRNAGFPAGDDRKYVVKMIYKNQNRPTVSYTHTIADDSTQNPLQAVFDGNTLGGQVKLEADFYIGSWLAGKATTGWLENNEATMAAQSLYLVEYPVPLNKDSIYVHNQILSYENGAYLWAKDSTAPTATIADRNTGTGGNYFGDWTGITLSQRKGMIGSSWQAAGMGIKECGSGTTGQLFAFQNVAIPGVANMAEKFPSCGFTGNSRMIYDTFPPKFLMDDQGQWVLDTNGHPVPDPKDIALGDYYLDPRSSGVSIAKGGGFHLRKVTLDTTTPFDMSSGQKSYGRFPLFPDSITLHPSLQIIGINSSTKKLMVAPLVEEGAKDTDIPIATFSSGPSENATRPGLMFSPVAVTCAYDGTILVLEDTSNDNSHSGTQVARISAYDLSMNPIERFFDKNGNPSFWLYIDTSTSKHYMDIQCVGDETLTYIYILGFSGAGDKVDDYSMAIYTYGKKAPASNPLVTTAGIAANGIAVDMWHTVYTQNFAIVKNANGDPAGPPVTDDPSVSIRTGVSLSQWLPPIPPSRK